MHKLKKTRQAGCSVDMLARDAVMKRGRGVADGESYCTM